MNPNSIYWFFALSGTVVLTIQLILTIIGIEGGGGAHDLSHDHDHGKEHTGLGFQLISVRTLTAFFAMSGWSGLAMLKDGHGLLATFVVSFLIGFATMAGIAWLLYFIGTKAVSATMDYNTVIGKIATVYMNIPANENDYGQINVDIGGKKTTMKAKSKVFIETGSNVKILSQENGIYQVEKI